MEQKNRKLLSYAGILNILEGAVLCVFKPAAIYGLIIMAIGVYFMAVSKNTMDEQDDHRILLLVVAIINIPINLISSILVCLAADNIASYRKSVNGINAPPEKKKEINPEAKKIDLLLKLGVAMVFISGILFATTTWSFISDIVKAIVLNIKKIFKRFFVNLFLI